MFEKLRLLARTDRRFLVTATALLVALCLDLALVAAAYMQGRHIEFKRALVKERSETLDALRVGTENAAAVLGKSREIKSLAGQLEQPVVQSDMVSIIFDLAGQTGVTVRDQNFVTAGEASTDSTSLSQTLVLSGKYREIRAFVKKIETQATGITVVERAEVAADKAGKVLARLKLRTYGGVSGDE